MSRRERGAEPEARRESLRAFVAVAPDASLRAALGRARASLENVEFAAALRWVPPENLHLTLRFLGEVALDTLPALRSALREELREQERFDLPLRGLGFFPNARRPRALAATLADDERLQALVARVEAALRASGLPEERRPFRAHITLARFRRGQRAGQLPEVRLEATRLEVTCLALVRSVLTPSGARYTNLESFALAPTLPGR